MARGMQDVRGWGQGEAFVDFLLQMGSRSWGQSAVCFAAMPRTLGAGVLERSCGHGGRRHRCRILIAYERSCHISIHPIYPYIND